MLRFSIPLILAFLLFSVRVDLKKLPKCEGLRDILAFSSCIPVVNKISQYTNQHEEDSNPEVLKNITILCENASKCFESIQCQGAAMAKAELEKSCEMVFRVFFAEDNNSNCLEGFFTAASKAQFSDEPSCFQKFDFLTQNLTIRQDAYSRGEACFTEFAKDHCNKTSIDFFSKNYKTFADAISIKPPDTECKSEHDQLNLIQCKAIGVEAKTRINALKGTKIESNDVRVKNALKLCRDTQNCMSDSCLVPPPLRQRLNESCDFLEMTQTSFGVCLSGIMWDKPDLSKFNCLGDMDFFDKADHVTCQKYTTKKECLKEVMTSVCGKESVADFDMIAEKVKKQFECN